MKKSLFESTAAMVVLYNPSRAELDKLISRNIYHYTKFYIIDNSHSENTHLKEIALTSHRIEYIHFPENLGLSKAYNIGLNNAETDGFEWLLLLDQDSEFNHKNILDIEKKLPFIDGDKNDIAILACRPHPNPENATRVGKEIESVYSVLSSGSILNIKKCLSLGGFDERFFIDVVDCEFAFRVKINQWRIIQFNHILFKHTIGLPKEFKLFGKTIIAYNHAPLRRYYMVRNNLELYRLYRKTKDIHIKKILYFSLRTWVLRQFILIFFEKDKKLKLKYFLLGAKDFFLRKFGSFKET